MIIAKRVQHAILPFSAVRDVIFTVDASEARSTGTCIRVNIVFACSSIFARGTLAFINLQSTARPCKSRQATTVE